MTIQQLLEEIERLQNIQKTHSPRTAVWQQAHRKLQPLFKAMAQKTNS